MPAPLLKAHQELGRAVDRCYRPELFPSDRHRVEYLFGRRERLSAPLAAGAQPERQERGGKPQHERGLELPEPSCQGPKVPRISSARTGVAAQCFSMQA